MLFDENTGDQRLALTPTVIIDADR